MFLEEGGILPVLLGVFAFAGSLEAQVFSVNYPSFSDCTGLQLNSSAACTGGALRLTPASLLQVGSAFLTEPVPISPGTTFAAEFTIQMGLADCLEDDSSFGADGITFTVQSQGPTALGSFGGGMGYLGIAPSLGVEIDTWYNPEYSDPDGNHLGINLGGSFPSVAATPIMPFWNATTSGGSGPIWFLWVDYNGSQLEVRASTSPIKPVTPTLSWTGSLFNALGGGPAYFGFTAATGWCVQVHDVRSFRLTVRPQAPKEVPTLGLWGLVGLVGALAGFGMWLQATKGSYHC
jgi:hypothetical protein